MPDQTPPVRWQPDRSPAVPAWPVPPMLTAIGRGILGRCPACGQTRCFSGYLRVVPVCVACTAPLGSLRADDLPPYLTIFIVGHIIIGLMVWVERAYRLDFWVQAALWLPVSLVLTMALLRPVKGGVLGLMLKLGLAKPDDE
ncbi:MAG TPA: DUF983 domain-containing protein [Acetobacteraceae bacterium]